ncbi:hypothetical protein Tco_0550718 [Tanacetum coccineum]
MGKIIASFAQRQQKKTAASRCLKLIENDNDLFVMYDYAEMYGSRYVMSHISQNLADFYYQNLHLDDFGDEVTSRRRFHELRKKDAGREEPRVIDIRDKCIADLAEVEIPAPRVVDKGKGIMLDVEHVVKHRKPTVQNKGIVIEENQNATFMDDTSSDSGSEPVFNNSVYSDSGSERDYYNKFVGYLSKGDDEVIKLRKRKNKSKRAPNQVKNKPTNNHVHIWCSIPKRVFRIHESYNVLEHEDFMNELLKRLKDGENGIINPF